MPYLGNDPGKLGTVLMDSFTGNGSTVAFTLGREPPNSDALIVTVDGVVQHPTGAWSISANILTFSTAPDSSAEIRVWHLSSTNTVDIVEDNAITLAKMAGGTDGNIISYDASGDPVAIATGDEGEVLTSAGEGAPPAFAAAAGGGKIGQVITSPVYSTRDTTTSSSFVDMGGPAATAITPSADSSKILIMMNCAGLQAGSNEAGIDFKRAIAEGATTSNISGAAYGVVLNTGTGEKTPLAIFVDSPNTEAVTTYTPQWRNQNGSTTIYCHNTTTASIMVLMEILA
jgi:hypothetical protein